MTQRLVVLRSSDDPEYDMYLTPPANMSHDDAVKFVDALVKRIKATDPDRCPSSPSLFDALIDGIDEAGFTWPTCMDCEEVW